MAAQKQTEKLAGNEEVSLGHKHQILLKQVWMKTSKWCVGRRGKTKLACFRVTCIKAQATACLVYYWLKKYFKAKTRFNKLPKKI